MNRRIVRILLSIGLCHFIGLGVQAQGICLDVPAYVSSGVSFGNVVAGQTYAYSASGCVQRSLGNFADPDGNQYTNGCTAYCTNVLGTADFTCPGLTAFSLVGKINGGACFQLGKSGNFIAAASGELVLYFNDNIYGDNSGSWSVCVWPTSSGACSTTLDLIAEIEGLNLNRGKKNSLEQKLSLRPFINEVRALKRSGRLDPTTADSLIDCAEAISPGSLNKR